MAGQRIEIMDLRQLIQLKEKGFSNRNVAKALKIGRNTVNDYVSIFKKHAFSYTELSILSEKDLAELFPISDYKSNPKYEELAQYFSYFEKELTKPGCTLQTLWYWYLDKYPDGYRYTQYVTYYNLWSHKVKASGILHHKAGEKLFVDFTGKLLSYIDRSTGEIRKAEVFVGILPCSQYTYVQAVDSQKREDFIDALNGCLHWIGGVPKAIVSDNLKSAVSKGHKYAPLINKTLKDFALQYNCYVDPTRPYHPQDKALVEGAVNLVYQRIFYHVSKHTFFSLKELNEAIWERLEVYNKDLCFQNQKITRYQRYLEVEKEFMADLPPSPYQIRYYRNAKVQKIGHVFLSEDKNYYSVPYRYIGHQVEVQYNKDLVEVFFRNDRVASHKRCYKAGHYTTVNIHMPSSHQAYNDWSPEYFENKAKAVGEFTHKYIHRLIAQYTYPELGYKQSQGILAFLKAYKPERIENACKRGFEYQKSSYHTIEKILKNNLDMEDDLFKVPLNSIPVHENIRGRYN
jgi:transposase